MKISPETLFEVARVSREWPDGIHTCEELQKLEPGRRPCTCGRCPAAGSDFEVRLHVHDGFQVGRIMHVCTVCGALGRTGVIWGRAPGQPRLDPDVEAGYRMEQAS
jgi:hypothetical protein